MIHRVRTLQPIYGISHSTAPPPDVRDEDLEIVGYMLSDCPGCGHQHYFATRPWMRGKEPGPTWSFNGDTARPDFSPSVLQKGCHWNKERQVDEDYVCHFFLKQGEFDFLDDSTHALAGRKLRVAWDG